MFDRIYSNLCEGNKSRREDYKKYSGLHEHHIVPKHMGGTDDDCNLTYLNVREHIIAHYLLWKIYKNPNDLRSMKMLGANLSPQHRKIIGEFCRDNQIGLFSTPVEERKEWMIRGIETQKQEYLNDKIKNFYYWSTEEGRKERASLGGKAHKGKKVMHLPGTKGWKRILPQDIDIKLNEGWKFGTGEPAPNSKVKNNFINQ